MTADKILLSLVLAAVCCGAGSAHAGLVHRCRSADGAIVYRDAPCALGEATLDRREFADPVSSTPVDTPSQAPAPRTPRTTPARAGPASAPARADRIVAHECRFGEQRWVQAQACPRSLTVTASRGTKPVKQSVDETRLTSTQVCGALRGTSSANAPGEGSARRAYGMNRLRQQHGC